MTTPVNRDAACALAALLQSWVARKAVTAEGIPGPLDDGVFALARRNRLTPLLALCLHESAGDLGSRCVTDYRFALLQGMGQLQAGCALSGAMRDAGIPTLAVRGPFAAVGWYGDAGARFSTDVDLLVPRAQREAARAVASVQGFRLRAPDVPAWLYTRNHYHWSLVRAADGLLCDLHWALDHRYALIRVDYAAVFSGAQEARTEGGAWCEPAPEHQLLGACLHLSREIWDAAAIAADAEGFAEAAGRGSLLLWMDVAAIIRRYGRGLDWDRIVQIAGAWRMRRELAVGLRGAQGWFGAAVPCEVASQAAGILAREGGRTLWTGYERQPWVQRWALQPGWRSMMVRFGVPCLCPARGYLRARSRMGRAAERVVRLPVAVARLADGVAADFAARGWSMTRRVWHAVCARGEGCGRPARKEVRA